MDSSREKLQPLSHHSTRDDFINRLRSLGTLKKCRINEEGLDSACR